LKFQFIGYDERTYPQLVIDGAVLVARPGEKREFEIPPSDGLWVEVVPPKDLKPPKGAKEN